MVKTSRALPLVLVLSLLTTFAGGVYVGVKLAPQLARASDTASVPATMKPGGGCPMMGGQMPAATPGQSKGGGCGMMSGKPASEPAVTTDKAPSAGCPMMKHVTPAKAESRPHATAPAPAHARSHTAQPAHAPAVTTPAVTATPAAAAAQKDEYICTMCPEVHSDKPGQCPKCGMALVKKGK